MKTIHYTHCPVCNSTLIRKCLETTDETVTNEVFEIWECSVCTGRFTQNIPSAGTIGKYYQADAYISHSNTRSGLVNKLYHAVRSVTLSGKRKLILSHTNIRKGKLLDIGAGIGSFVRHMRHSGWETTGLEPGSLAVSRAQRLYGLDLLAPETLYSLPSGEYDAITLWHVLEHVHELHPYMEQFSRLLKPDGLIFIAVPNFTSFDCSIYGKWWAAYDVPRHLYHFSPGAMRNLVHHHQFEMAAIKPMWYDSFYVSMLSEKNKTGRNNYIKAFITGLRSNWKALRNKERASSLIYIIRHRNPTGF